MTIINIDGVRLNVNNFDAVLHVEDVQQINEDVDFFWWNHDIHRMVDASWLSPEIVFHALFVQLNQSIERCRIFWCYLEQLVSAISYISKLLYQFKY